MRISPLSLPTPPSLSSSLLLRRTKAKEKKEEKEGEEKEEKREDEREGDEKDLQHRDQWPSVEEEDLFLLPLQTIHLRGGWKKGCDLRRVHMTQRSTTLSFSLLLPDPLLGSDLESLLQTRRERQQHHQRRKKKDRGDSL